MQDALPGVDAPAAAALVIALRAVGAERFLVAIGDAQIEHLTGLQQAGFRVDRARRRRRDRAAWFRPAQEAP